MELIKDYDCEILYHPGKANVVADALSRKSYANYMCYAITHVTSVLMNEIKDCQVEASKEPNLKSERMVGMLRFLSEDSREIKIYRNRV